MNSLKKMIKNNKKIIFITCIITICLIIILTFIFNALGKKKKSNDENTFISTDNINISGATLEANPILWDFNRSCIGWHSIDSVNNIPTEKSTTGYMAVLFDENYEEYLLDKYLVIDINNKPLIGLGVRSGSINSSDSQYLKDWIDFTQPDATETYNDKNYFIYIVPIGEDENQYNVKTNTINNVINFSYSSTSEDNDSFMREYVKRAGWPTEWLRKNYETWNLNFIMDGMYDKFNYNEKIIIPTKEFYENSKIDDWKNIDFTKSYNDNYLIYTVTESCILTDGSKRESQDLDTMDDTIPEGYVSFNKAIEFTNKVYYQIYGIPMK